MEKARMAVKAVDLANRLNDAVMGLDKQTDEDLNAKLQRAIKRKGWVSAELEEKAMLALSRLNPERISARSVVEILTLANQLRNEALELEKNMEDNKEKVTEIVIKRFSDD